MVLRRRGMNEKDGSGDWFRRGFYFAAGVLALIILLSILGILLTIPSTGGSSGSP
jgi:hypothetical protein